MLVDERMDGRMDREDIAPYEYSVCADYTRYGGWMCHSGVSGLALVGGVLLVTARGDGGGWRRMEEDEEEDDDDDGGRDQPQARVRPSLERMRVLDGQGMDLVVRSTEYGVRLVRTSSSTGLSALLAGIIDKVVPGNARARRHAHAGTRTLSIARSLPERRVQSRAAARTGQDRTGQDRTGSRREIEWIDSMDGSRDGV